MGTAQRPRGSAVGGSRVPATNKEFANYGAIISQGIPKLLSSFLSFFSFVKAKLLERIVCLVKGINGLSQSFLGLSSTFFKLLVILQNLDSGASLLDESFPKFSEVIMPSFGLLLYLICSFVVALILFALQIFI